MKITTLEDKKFRNIWSLANKAANKAGSEVTPTPMRIGLTVGFGNQIVPGTEETINEGVCGFASLKLKGRGKFAFWLKENGYARKGVYGGLHVPSYSLYDNNTQSYERKVEAMGAASTVLREYGISAFVESRLD